MNYSIDTFLIWDSFRSNSECPICLIYDEIEKRIVDQFLNEAVMIDEFRHLVNKYGFCGKHYHKLFNGQNKLGTSLQTLTRLKTILDNFGEVKNRRSALKQAKDIQQSLNTCAICNQIQFNMDRYYAEIAGLYKKDKDFMELFREKKGFCMEHYSKLLEASNHAGLKQREFIRIISKQQKENLERLHAELNWFCDKFDYRNSDKDWKNSKDALFRTVNKLHRGTLTKNDK